MLDLIADLINQHSHERWSILVVGDGNFSFSRELSQHQFIVNGNTKLFATSLDLYCKLERCDITLENINELTKQENVEIKHGVDATLLKTFFPNIKFHVIIFNFPHVGGKSNIKKCRILLQDFFQSCADVLVKKGHVIVSLCKGQGGLPCDQSRGAYGNSWQVSTQAANAGFILTDVRAFERTQISRYSESGYRGNIDKWFHTNDALVHVFNIATLPSVHEVGTDLLTSFQTSRSSGRTSAIYNALVGVIDEAILTFDTSLNIAEINLNNKNISNVADVISFTDDGTSVLTNTYITDCSLFNLFKNSPTANKLKYITWKPCGYISPFIQCASMKLVYRFQSRDQLKVNLTNWVKSRLFQHFDLAEHLGENGQEMTLVVGHENSSSKQSFIVNSVPYFIHDLSEYYVMQYQPEITIYGCEGNQEGYKIIKNSNYILTDQEKVYFQKTFDRSSNSDFSSFYIKGLPVVNIIEKDNNVFIEFILNNILQTCYPVEDLRLISSRDEIFQNDLLARIEADKFCFHGNQLPLKTLVQYPLCFRHDICFWFREGQSEEHLFEEMRKICTPYLHSVRLLRVLRYEDSGQISYCYRMIYSCVDASLTHAHTVQLQNSLRKRLMSVGYDLR